MATASELKGKVTIADFAAALEVSKEAVSKFKRTGLIKADRFVKQGKKLYVHLKDAKADLAVSPLPTRGPLPRWIRTVGHKQGIAQLKANEKAAAKAAKIAA